jgi:hypothetical protein
LPPSEIDPEQLGRLRHYSTVRAPEVRQVIEDARREEHQRAVSATGRSNTGEHDLALPESNSVVRSMLSEILQRLDTRTAGHALQAASSLSARNTVLDPFNLSTITITPSMNAVLRHCKSVYYAFSPAQKCHTPRSYILREPCTISNGSHSFRRDDTLCVPNSSAGRNPDTLGL